MSNAYISAKERKTCSAVWWKQIPNAIQLTAPKQK